MTKTIKNITASDRLKPLTFKLLLVGVFLMASSYIYLISSTVTGTVGGEKMIKKITEVKHQIVDLEKDYIKGSSSLDGDFAILSGFGQPEKVVYVSRFEVMAQR